MRNRSRRILLFAIRVCVVAILAACVCLSLMPRSLIASAMGTNDCCVGKSAGHCTISLRKQRRTPKPEPMCGLKRSPQDDDATILARDGANESEYRRVKHSDPCNDCPSCTLGLKKRSRDKSFVTSVQAIGPVTNSEHPPEIDFQKVRSLTPIHHIRPRGPPLS